MKNTKRKEKRMILRCSRRRINKRNSRQKQMKKVKTRTWRKRKKRNVK